ncbi:LptF/LptG family permease, partial [Alphaproteobacteria bacterium]|nr:LptF/LptG family permease [Alphaproteobacteria bacterium]
MSWRLGLYISRVFLRWVGVAFALLTALIFLMEFIELTRRASGHEGLSSVLLLKLALYKTPAMVDLFLPFMSFFGAMLAYWRFQKGSELIAMSALGVSGSRIFMPVACVSLLLGIVNLALFNPISATLKERYETLDQRFFQQGVDAFAIHKTGLWVRQKQGGERTIILHADQMNMKTQELFHLSAYLYNKQGDYQGRIDAERGIVNPKGLRLLKGWKTSLNETPQHFNVHELPLDLSFTQLKRSLKTPQTLSFWEISGFVTLLEQAGISSRDHTLHWHRLLAGPLWLCALALLALATMLTTPRQEHILKRLLLGLGVGFFLYFLRDITQGMASA